MLNIQLVFIDQSTNRLRRNAVNIKLCSIAPEQRSSHSTRGKVIIDILCSFVPLNR